MPPTLIVVALALASSDAKINYKEQVSAIFQARCNSCHNGDKQKGGLSLDTFGNALKGGSSGAVVEPGDPDNSRLYLLVSHAEEPKMPPNSPRIPDEELATIKQWIEAGAPENSGSVVVATKPKLDFKLDPSSIGKPSGPAAMPEGVTTEPVVVSARPNAITALASSPWAPLVAVSGHKQVLLYDTSKNRLAAVLPFPEGTIHALKFTRDGAMVLAAGGRGGQSGRVVVWDVKTGERLFEVGNEYDVVLAADISPDRGLVALGGPSKVLKVYGSADGELVYESKKHTEWVTAVEFSPDGVLLASGDRNGGLLVWETVTGREFYDLRGHQAQITDVSWRLDSNLLASASEDATVRLWEMQNGTQVKSWGAHGGGTLSVRFAKDGRLVTAGRDRVAKLFDQNGGQQRQFEGFGDVATKAEFGHDDASVIAGDWSGEVRMWELKEGKRIANLAANPAPVATRLARAEEALAGARSEADSASREMAALQSAVTSQNEAVGKFRDVLAEAQKQAGETASAVVSAEVLFWEKSRAEWAAHDTAWSADFVRDRLNENREAASEALRTKSEAARAASEVFAATKTDHDRRIAEKAAASEAVAARLVEDFTTRATAATEAANASRSAQEVASGERSTAEYPLVALREAAAQSSAAVPMRQGELDAATAALAAAEKAVAEKSPVAQALAARAATLQEETQALAAERKAAETARTSAGTTASKS